MRLEGMTDDALVIESRRADSRVRVQLRAVCRREPILARVIQEALAVDDELERRGLA